MNSAMMQQTVAFATAAIISWFGIGASLVYALNLIKFEVPLAKELRACGAYDDKTFRKTVNTSWIGCAIMFLAGCALVALFIRKNVPMGLVMTAVGIFLAFFTSSRSGGRDREAVRRYLKAHMVTMDKEALSVYVKETYGWELEDL